MTIDCAKHGKTEGIMTGMFVLTPVCRKCLEEFRSEFQAFIARQPPEVPREAP